MTKLSTTITQQRVLDLLRDTKQTEKEIALELNISKSMAAAVIKELIEKQLLTVENDFFETRYTSDYDTMKIKVYQLADDKVDEVIGVQSIQPHMNFFDALFFKKVNHEDYL